MLDGIGHYMTYGHAKTATSFARKNLYPWASPLANGRVRWLRNLCAECGLGLKRLNFNFVEEGPRE